MTEIHPDCCGYPTAAHADFAIDGKCVIELPDEPRRVATALTVEITVSKPYVAIGLIGGTRRPQGIRRTYSAVVLGSTIKNESKAEIQRVIRQKVNRELGDVRVRFEFVEATS